MPRTKTTEDERIKIVRYCIEHDCNYGKTASLYGVSYHQVYEWCKKFRNSGEEGLKDNRGKLLLMVIMKKITNISSR